jgi:hypothetical protein
MPTITQTANEDWPLLVELALLADPVAYQCPVKATLSDKGLTLRGYVPHQHARDVVLGVVQKTCPLPVDDQLVLQGNMAIGLIGKAPPNLAELARTRLAKIRPELGQSVQIQLSNQSLLVLAGRVQSMEEKTQCSRTLRGLPGCTGIKNELVVGGAPVPILIETPTQPMPLPTPVPIRVESPTQPTPVRPVPAKDSGSVIITLGASTAPKPVPKPVEGVPATITFEEEPAYLPPPPPTPTVPSPAEQTKIKSLILANAAGVIKDVELRFSEDASLEVIATVAGTANFQQLGPLVTELPELKAFQPKLTIRVE